MKKEIIIGLSLLILLSCNRNQNQNSENSVTTDSTIVIDEIQSNEFSISEFPAHWYILNPAADGSGYVMNQWCLADIQQITIETTENNAWSFKFNNGQEQTTWKLMNFEAKSVSDDLLDYVEGSFSLTPFDGASVTPDAVEFYWNRTEKYCNFKGDVIGDNRFVNEEEKGSYKLIEEDCSDF